MFLFSISLHQGEGLEHLMRTWRWPRWWCRWTQAADKISEETVSNMDCWQVQQSFCCFFGVQKKGTGHQLSSWIFHYLQRSSTDKETIDIRLCCQLFAVRSSYRTCSRMHVWLSRWFCSQHIKHQVNCSKNVCTSIDDPCRFSNLRANIDL